MATTGILDVQYTKRIITEDWDDLDAFCHRFQHVAAENDVCLIMGNDTVQLVHKLDVVWEGIAAQNVVKQILVLGIVKILCPGSFLVISVEQNDFRGDRRAVGQSSVEACSQVSCSPGDQSDDVVQKMAGINQHHVSSTRSRDRDRDLTSTALSPSIKQPYSSIRAGETGLISNWKTSAMSKLRCSPTTNSLLSEAENCLLCSPPMANAF